MQAAAERRFQRRETMVKAARHQLVSRVDRHQVDVDVAEDPQMIEELVGVVLEPVALFASGPAGIRDHELIALVGLSLPGIGRRLGARPARAVRNRHSDDSLRQLGDRVGLVDHQSRRAVLVGPVRQDLQGGLVVDHARSK